MINEPLRYISAEIATAEAKRVDEEIEKLEAKFHRESKPYKDELSKLSRGYFILQESNRKDLEMAKRSKEIKRKMNDLIGKIGKQYSKLTGEIEKIRISSKNYPDVEATCYDLQELELVEK